MCSSIEIEVDVTQAPYYLRKAFESELLEASREAAVLVRELRRNINNMQQLNIPKLLLEKVHTAAERLQSKIEEQSHLLLNYKPRIIISPELSHDSPLNSPRSSPDDKNDLQSNCEPSHRCLWSLWRGSDTSLLDLTHHLTEWPQIKQRQEPQSVYISAIKT